MKYLDPMMSDFFRSHLTPYLIYLSIKEISYHLSSLYSAGGTGTVTISFNLVDDSNLDSLFQNVTGGPKMVVFDKEESTEVRKVGARFHLAFYSEKNPTSNEFKKIRNGKG